MSDFIELDERRRTGMRRGRWMGVIAGSAVLLLGACAAEAAKCGSTGANFEAWKETFSAEAKNNGIKPEDLG